MYPVRWIVENQRRYELFAGSAGPCASDIKSLFYRRHTSVRFSGIPSKVPVSLHHAPKESICTGTLSQCLFLKAHFHTLAVIQNLLADTEMLRGNLQQLIIAQKFQAILKA